MKLLKSMLAAFALAASPAAAAAQPAAPPKVEVVQQDLTAVGVWLQRLTAAQAPLQAEVQQLRVRWQEAMTHKDLGAAAASFRPYLERFRQKVVETDAALAALEAPDMGAIDFPDSIEPAKVVAELRETNKAMAGAIGQMNPFLDAMARKDLRGAEAAAAGMMASLKHVMDGQAVMLRAARDVTPREQSGWELVNVELLMTRSASRLVAAWPTTGLSRTDPSLAPDLLALAEEVTCTAEDGAAKLEGERTRTAAALAEVGPQGGAQADVLRRTLKAQGVYREVFVLARELAAELRTSAAEFKSGRVSVDTLGKAMHRVAAIRPRLDAIAVAQGHALAGGD